MSKEKKNVSEKELKKLMDMFDESDPYSTYLSESTLSRVDEHIDTGSLALNAIISGSMYKGIPVGRVIQFAGESMTGKTYFVQKIIANAQKAGKTVIVFDSENAIEAESAKRFGIDPTKVKYFNVTTIEQTRNKIYKILQGASEIGAVGKFVIIIDSLGNMESELGEKRMGKDSTSSDMGTLARAIKSLLKTCTNWGGLTRSTIVFTNHVYDDPSAMYPSIEKNINGGKSVVYLPSVTVQLTRKPMKDDEGKTIDKNIAVGQKSFSGIVLKCLTVKNRFLKQYLEAELYLSFSSGLDKYYGLLELMKGMGVVTLNGSIYTDWEGNKLGYYKSWRKDKDLWEDKLLPELENRFLKEWSFSGEDVPAEDDELDSEDSYQEDEEEIIEYEEEEIPDEE
jgi:RecA/RadA recombinase